MPTDPGTQPPDWSPPPLPRYLSTFVGREREATEVAALLRDRPLLTLTGPGGVGKTRLAVHVAAALAADPESPFGAGIAFVALEDLEDPDRLAAHLAQLFALPDRPDRAAEERLVDHLRGRRLLLVLDNFEHLLDAAPVVARLLRACPDLTVLATSREALALDGEQVYVVEPLSLPRRGGEEPSSRDVDAARLASPTSRLLDSSEAVRLFVDRARRRDARFQLTEANAPAVAELCRRLDGLPLAIEFAAALAPTVPPEALTAGLDARLPLLGGDRRDATPRHRTVADMLAWSYDRLPAPLQTLFRRLGVFVGGWTVAAATAVAEEAVGRSGGGAKDDERSAPSSERPIALVQIEALAGRHLVRPLPTVAGEPRFGFLETTRAYALELLRAHGEEEPTRRAHAAFFLEFAEAAAAGLAGPEQATWAARLDPELPNLRLALRWFLEEDSAEDAADHGLRLANALWRYWDRRGFRREAQEWLEKAIARSEGRPSADRAAAYRHLANSVRDVDRVAARMHYESSLVLAREVDDAFLAAAVLNNLGALLRDMGQYQAAVASLTEALELARRLGDRRALATAWTNLGTVANDTGDFPTAAACCRDALALWAEIGDHDSTIAVEIELARMARRQGHFDEAERWLGRAGELARTIAASEWASWTDLELGLVAHRRGDDPRALHHLTSAVVALTEMGSDFGVVQCLEAIGSVASIRGQAAEAAKLWGAAEAWRARTGNLRARVDQTSFKRELKRVRAVMTDAHWEAAWEAGTRLSIFEASRLALAIGSDVRTPITSIGPGRVPEAAHPLSTRELEVLRLAAQDLSDPEIADRLSLSPRTINTHLSNIYQKLGVKGRLGAVLYAIRQGWVDPAA